MQKQKLIFDIDTFSRLSFSNEATGKLLSCRQKSSASTEAGGLLLGRYLLSSPCIIVDDITMPCSIDKRSRYSFFRSLAHNIMAARTWRKSNKTCSTLGTWHTHAEPTPNPSGKDFQDWINILRKGRYQSDYLFFLILGTQAARVWQGFRSGNFVELSRRLHA